LAGVYALEYPLQKALAGLRGFQAVEHRIEYVGEYNGSAIYNDSKSTNVDSLRVALESFSRPIVLIAGGRGKGESYRSLRPLAVERVSHLVTLGEDAPRIEAELAEDLEHSRAADLEEAVTQALAAAQPGGTVLFSPGCSSFDMYTNFEERGRHFKEIIGRHLSGAARKEAHHAT
jgi:UDP-N-acetylmuramoylalanine--D-glutamate ligase